RLQSGLLFLASIALLIPSALATADRIEAPAFTRQLSIGLSVLLIAAYALGLLFSLRTHSEIFASAQGHGTEDEEPWRFGAAVGALGVITLLVALVSEVFVESVQHAAIQLGMSPAFVGFIVVALVGAAAEMASAFTAARKDRLDMSVSIALGSAAQLTLFVAPVVGLLSFAIPPSPSDLRFWPGAVVMVMLSVITVSLVTNSGQSAWYVGVQLLMVYLIFAITLYLLPPAPQSG